MCRDQASANKIVMDRLGVKHCRLAIGASMGGMLSMELVVSYPDWIGEVSCEPTAALRFMRASPLPAD